MNPGPWTLDPKTLFQSIGRLPAARSTALFRDQLVLLVVTAKEMGTLKAVYEASRQPMTISWTSTT